MGYKKQMFRNQNGSFCSSIALHPLLTLSYSVWTNMHPYTGKRSIVTGTYTWQFQTYLGKECLAHILLLFISFESLFTLILCKTCNSCWIWFGSLTLCIISPKLSYLVSILGDSLSMEGVSGICMFKNLHKGFWYVAMIENHPLESYVVLGNGQ